MDQSSEPLTPEQLYFARVMFENRVRASTGQKYEDLFVSVMTKRNRNFRPVKPQGRIGDQGNDGFEPADGRYYQVYAPEDPTASVATAAKKAKGDFAKLKRHWDADAAIVDYRFVFNDKYQGAYPEVEHALSELKREHGLEVSQPFLAKDLEREFMELSRADKEAVLQTVFPRPEFIDDIDYAALTEILQHLVDNQTPLPAEGLPIVPGYTEKIVFNNIDRAAPLLTVGNYQNSAVEEFFDRHGEFTKTDIRNRLAHSYEAARVTTGDEDEVETTLGDRVFFGLLGDIAPQASRQVQDAAIVLISYFFEKCDVFEDPTT